MLPPNLIAALHANHHLLTYEGVMLSGVSPKELRTLVAAEALVRVRQGVYACGEHWRTASAHAGRGLLEARAASMTMTEDHVLSHDSSAHALGLPFLAPRSPLVHVTRRGVHGSRTTAGVKHHGARFHPKQVVTTPAGKSLDTARTAVDLVREHGLRIGLSACDSALRRGTRPADLEAAAAAMRCWRGIRSIRLALEWADPGAENPGESLARLAVLETGFGQPVTQLPVSLPDQVAWCDMVVGAHVIEFDGKVKYRPRAEGGLADADPGEVAWAERRRERALLQAGLNVSRLVWEDLTPQRWDTTRERLSREISTTWGQGGHVLPPHLHAFADRMAAERTARIRRRSTR